MRKIFFTILALCLATLANFALGNEFKNMLLNINFDKIGEDCYKINLETQIPYADEVKIVKKSDYNYYILLSETYAKTAVNSINADIISATVSLYPYVEQDLNNGYAKISLTTSRPLDFTVSLSAKTASKFPIMDLVKIAQLNQMYDKNHTTVKGGKTTIAQKPSAPAVVPQKVATPVPQITVPAKVEKPAQIAKVPQVAQETKIEIKPTIAQKQPSVVKPVVKKPAQPSVVTAPKLADKPAPVAKPVQKAKPAAPKVAQAPATTPKMPTAPKVAQQKPAAAPKSPVAPQVPVAQVVTPQAPVEPAPIAQEPVVPQVVQTPQETLPEPAVKLPPTKVGIAVLYEKYPIQVIVLILALLAFIVGLFQFFSMRTRKSEKAKESIGLGARPLYSAQEPAGEIFEEILDENIYANAPDIASKVEPEPEPELAYHEVLESAVPDFLEDFSEEFGDIEAEVPEVSTIELVKEEEQVLFESAPEPFAFTPEPSVEPFTFTPEPTPEPFADVPLAIEEDFTIDFGEESKNAETPFITEEWPSVEIVEEKPVQPKEPAPLKPAATSPIRPQAKPKTENVAKILSTAQVENDRGFYLADFKGVKSLVAYVMDNVFVIHSFRDAKIQNPQIDFRLSESGKQGDFYLVKVGDTKLVVKSEKEKMSLVNVA